MSELEPHEQLDEIDLRTNDDGSVQVKILEWEKGRPSRSGGKVVVSFRTPTGDVESQSMMWPEANSDKYEFIRFINETPYTLRTAEEINKDDDLWLDADPNGWNLLLPEKKGLSDRIPSIGSGYGKEIISFMITPAMLIGMLFVLLEFKDNHSRIRGSKYDNHSFIDSRDAESRYHGGIKWGWYALLWPIFALIVLALLI